MGKRKRDDEAEEPSRELSAKQRRVEYKLRQAITKLGHAFKVAKGFERQKLGRRKKSAGESNKDENRIDSEIVALKALDTTSSAQQHLHKSLLKTKAVSEHPDLPAEVRLPVSLAKDAATLNVTARLCKSNQVQDALASAVNEIQLSMGLEAVKTAPAKKRRVRAKDFNTDKSTSRDRQDATEVADHSSLAKSRQENVGPVDEGEDSDDLTAFNDRIAASSDESEAEPSNEEHLGFRTSKDIHPKTAEKISKRYDLAADLSISGSESERQSLSPEPQKVPATKKSSYLPSLTMAGYISGSGSEVDDEIDIAPKRNRRGQRARQQIWEQKFGAKAKHLQKQDRKAGWDPKRGAVDGSERRGKGRSRQFDNRSSPDYTLGSNDNGISSKPVRSVKKKHRDDDGPIHPSWEAAKKAKEKKEAPVAFQGKKTTFG